MARTIFGRTHFTTRRQLDNILAGAAAKGELDQLFWFIEMKLPGTMTTTGKTELAATHWPGKWVPIIPVGDDPYISRIWAELLATFFRLSNPGMEFGLALTAADLAQQYACYEWGDPRWDNICAVCGAVMVDNALGVDLCEVCAERSGSIVVVKEETYHV